MTVAECFRRHIAVDSAEAAHSTVMRSTPDSVPAEAPSRLAFDHEEIINRALT